MESLPIGMKVRRHLARIGLLQRQFRGAGEDLLVHRTAEYETVWRRLATELGADFETLDRGLWQLTRGDQRIHIAGYLLPVDDPAVLALAARKPLVHGLLAEAGLPVPPHRAFRLPQLDTAKSFLADEPSGCVVVKPADAYGGLGVSVYVRDGRSLERAAILASLRSRSLLVERQVFGESCRVLVFDGEVVHAVRRRAFRVEGDGVATLAAAVRAAGVDPSTLRGDPDALFSLASQRLTWDSVPAVGCSVIVRCSGRVPRGDAELRTVYDDDLTERLHPAVAADAVAAADVVGARLLGVDVITPDPERDLRDVGGTINEVNTTPALLHHYDPECDPYPRPALAILDRLLEQSGTS